MANTHDFIIANDTGANVRQDLNTLLLQIKATNAGDSAPTSVAEGMLWYETDDDVLHLYNGSAWVEIIKAVGSGTGQSLGTGDVVTHANLAAITGAVQGLGQGNTPTFTGLVIADGTNDLNIASHDGTNGLKLGGQLVTASAPELNLLDGVTDICTQAELDARVSAATPAAQGVGTGNSPTFAGATFSGTVNIADGTTNLNIISHDGSTGGLKLENVLVTSTTAELNIMDGVTATTAELNIMDGVTATATELNKLDGFTGTTANLNLLAGQSQLGTSVPVGGIIALASSMTGSHSVPNSGSVDSAGWMLCDGSSVPGSQTVSGTLPNLTDGRYLEGNTSANAGGTGGNTIPSHTHTGPSHSHTVDSHHHAGPAHTHNVNNHNHGGGSHRHDTGTGNANADRLVAHRYGSNAWTSGKYYTDYPNTHYEYTAWSTYSSGSTGYSAPGTSSAGTGNTGSTSPGTNNAGTGATGGYGTGSDVLPKYYRVVYLMRVI